MKPKSIAVAACSVLLVIALTAASQSLWIQGKAWLAQRLLHAAWETTLRLGEQQKPWPWADTWPVARLRIPSLNISLVVLEGLSGEAMAFGPARMQTSTQSGLQGVTLIGGHRDTHLEFLKELKPGALFELHTSDGKQQKFRWSHHWVADSTKDQLQISRQESGLVLVTCYPFNAAQTGGPLRFVVVALPETRQVL